MKSNLLDLKSTQCEVHVHVGLDQSAVQPSAVDTHIYTHTPMQVGPILARPTHGETIQAGPNCRGPIQPTSI